MSQQSDDDLARALEGLGGTSPKRPAAKVPQAPAKAPQPVARPPQPAAKPMQMPRSTVRHAGGTSSVPTPRAARAATPLDAPAAMASSLEAKPAEKQVTKTSNAGASPFRRTMIPILLTLGFILVALCAVRFVWKSDDNPMLGVSPIEAAVFGGFGIVVWALAALLMSGVARQLRALAEFSAPEPAATPNRPSRVRGLIDNDSATLL